MGSTVNQILEHLDKYVIDQFTVVCLVTWHLNGSKTGIVLALIQTSVLLSCKITYV